MASALNVNCKYEQLGTYFTSCSESRVEWLGKVWSMTYVTHCTERKRLPITRVGHPAIVVVKTRHTT